MLISTYSSKLRGKAGKSHVMGGSEFSLNSVIIQDIHFRDQCIRVQTGTSGTNIKWQYCLHTRPTPCPQGNIQT